MASDFRKANNPHAHVIGGFWAQGFDAVVFRAQTNDDDEMWKLHVVFGLYDDILSMAHDNTGCGFYGGIPW